MKRYGYPAGAVVEAFVEDHRQAGTAADTVPGGRRVEALLNEGGRLDLFSYRTVVAVYRNGEFATTTKRYSRSTSKLMSRVERALYAAGFEPTADAVPVEAAVPGRWGGYGPAWAPSPFETIPFIVWRKN